MVCTPRDIKLDWALQECKLSMSSHEMQVKSLQEEVAKVKKEHNIFGQSVAALLGRYWCHDTFVIYFTPAL